MRRQLYDPRDAFIPDSSHNVINAKEREEMFHLLFRIWPRFLGGAELKIVMFIFDRTIMYNKRWEYVSIDTLHKGQPAADMRPVLANVCNDPKFYRNISVCERQRISRGDLWITGPTGLSRRHIIRALDTLVRQQFIFRITHKGKPECALNPDCPVDDVEYLMERAKDYL